MVAGGHVTRNQPPYDAEEGFERKTLLFKLMANLSRLLQESERS